MATTPSAGLVLTPLAGDARPLREWLTTFHMASIVVDPFTNESSWILDTAARVLRAFSGAAVRVNFIVTATPKEAKQFLGLLAEEFLVFVDPDRTTVRGLGLEKLPAFVFIQSDLTVPAAAEGWRPVEWRKVAQLIATTTAWLAPTIPGPKDPSPYAGTPALV
ncbi:MAG: hypothetical protein FJW44_01400 [Actinobacteria bacterium]|nr:hypothetical protein [Actinomycetota bacterium]